MLTSIKKQPKINHLYNKKILIKYNIGPIQNNFNYSVNLVGIPNFVSNMLIYMKSSESQIVINGNTRWHEFDIQLDDLEIKDGSGRNINDSSIVQD